MRDSEAYEIPPHLIEAMAVIYGHESESFNETMDIGVDFSVSWTKEEYDELMQRNEIDSNIGDEFFSTSHRLETPCSIARRGNNILPNRYCRTRTIIYFQLSEICCLRFHD